MRNEIIMFTDIKDIFDILGWSDDYMGPDCPHRWDEGSKYREKEELLWKNDFNLDDWDVGFACKEKLHYFTDKEGNKLTQEQLDDINARLKKAEEEDNYYEALDIRDGVYTEWIDSARWLGFQMEDYCVGHSYTEFGGYHWYLVHHA